MKKLMLAAIPVIALFLLYSSEGIEHSSNIQADVLNNGGVYSDEQIKVIEEFGKPDEFVINLNQEDEPRYEIWKYIGLGEIFIFEGGEYVSGTAYDFNVPEGEPYLRAKIAPQDVYNLKTIEDLSELVDVEPTAKGEVYQEVLEDTKYFDYGDVISAATTGDDLIYVKTQTFISQ